MNIAGVVAASRLVAQERAIEVTAMNLANVNTPGYQASRVQFATWLNAQPQGAGQGTGASGERTVAYTQDRATWHDTRQGALTKTGNPFDLSLPGGAYFTVATPNGPRLTRDGRFGPLSDGTVGDGAGNALMDNNGNPIRIGPTDSRITITGDGSLTSENGTLGKIGVVTPANPNALSPEGATLLRANTSTTQAASPGVVQGALEGSNVAAIPEVTRMMSDLRDYQFTTQLIQSEDDRIQSTIEKTVGTST
jgi:flagellar basal-body rod protein FlgF